jgi:hypothetical protein
MKALRDAFRVGIFIFFTLVVHGSRKRLGQHTVGRPIIIKTRQHATTQDGILSLALFAFYLPSISSFFLLLLLLNNRREIEDNPPRSFLKRKMAV